MEETPARRGGIPAERVRRIDDLSIDPPAQRGFCPMAEPRVGSMLTTGLPFRFSSGSFPAPSRAPALGEHSDDVLRDWLDCSDEEIQTSSKDQGALT